MSERVVIHTDGACSGNPGPGGWGAVLQYGSTVKELKGGEALTTNNRMELTAAIEALNALKRACIVELHTDSVYVKDGLTKWIHGWKRNGWRTSEKKPVKNVELWQALDLAVEIGAEGIGVGDILGIGRRQQAGQDNQDHNGEGRHGRPIMPELEKGRGPGAAAGSR